MYMWKQTCVSLCIVDSRSISFFSWCLTQWGVGDCGQPVRVRCQYEHTEASRVNTGWSELLDLSDLYGRRSSLALKSVKYSTKNVLINTVSNISSGRSLSFHRKHYNILIWLFSLYFLADLITFCWFHPPVPRPRPMLLSIGWTIVSGTGLTTRLVHYCRPWFNHNVSSMLNRSLSRIV